MWMCYNNALESSDELRAKSSIIESHDKEGRILRSTDIISKSSSLSWVVVDRSRVLMRFKAEKVRSAEHVLIGIATAIE